MKALYALVCIAMSLHAFTASAETPALLADDYSNYFSSIDNLDLREELAAEGTMPEADIASDPTIYNMFAVNADAEDYTADIVPGINLIPQSDEDLTGSFAEPWDGEAE